MPQIDELFHEALAHHRAGRLGPAAQAYQAVLRAQPGQPDASYLLAAIAYQSGQPAEAVKLIRQALSTGGDQPQYHNLLGLALMSLNSRAEAEVSFRRALVIDENPDFYNNLGICLKEQCRLAEAAAAYERAIAVSPHNANSFYNLGNLHRGQQQWEPALAYFRKAVEADANHAHALAAAGQVLLGLERAQEAIGYIESSLTLLPDDADVHCDLGDALQKLNRLQEATAAYGRAVQLKPQLARAWYSAGCIETSRKNHVTASACYRKALADNPDWPEALHNLGQALFELGQIEEALTNFRRAGSAGNSALSWAMVAVIIPGSPEADNAAVLATRRAFSGAELPVARSAGRFAGSPHRPLRIGYVSSFFHRDNWMKPVWGLINEHDREQFAIHLFSDAAATEIRHGYRPHPSDKFHDITGVSNEAVADHIEQLGIDLLVDLNGYSALRRLPLFALRPAPFLAGWFNMFATTGMSCYDCLIGDEDVIPPEEEQFYSERIVRVRGSYLTFRVAYPVPDIAPLPCATTGVFTFGCLAPQYKITNEVVTAFSRILAAAPHSVLLLKNAALDSPRAQHFVQDQFAAHGIAPERLQLEGPADHFEFLRTYERIDLALDTFPYNGGTTTTEAIWQGVPAVTFWGDRWVSRTSSSILRAANLGRFVASSLDEYVALATGLANSTGTAGELERLRQGMRANLLASPVCDTRSFAWQMERLYREIIGSATTSDEQRSERR